jgi:GT2 family glycosyltransferase
LLDALQAISNQTKKVDSVYIIDNSSTDGTYNFLVNKNYLEDEASAFLFAENSSFEKKYKSSSIPFEIIYIRLAENIGGAGGFYVGQKRAYEDGFEWIWLMDDDGFPSEACLQTLLHTSKVSGFRALNPLVFDRDNHERLAFGLSKKIMLPNEAIRYADDNHLIIGKANPFNGTLLNRSVVSTCGFIKKEMFIWGDEREYLYRLESHNVGYATDINAVFYHPRTKTRYAHIFFGLIKVDLKPERLEMNYYRNRAYIYRRYGAHLKHLLIIKNILYYLLNGNLKRILILMSYYWDGYTNTYKLKNIIE